jgi:NAD(P)-dependent dehydrogenase (short-subunit alcohol dehydrogenase family)
MILDRFRLDGKAAIVTGSSKGLGKAIALGLAQAGSDVMVMSRHGKELAPVVQDVKNLNRKAIAVEADVSLLPDHDRIVQTCLEELGRIDILVNNAGTIKRNLALDVQEEDWDHVLDTNLKGSFFLAQNVGAQMVKKGQGGKIINVTSIRANPAIPATATYGASKAGLLHLTKTMALEWVEYGINVNSIGPGYFQTPLTSYIPVQRPEEYQWLVERIPMKRFGQPEEIVGAAVYLASEASNYVTGQTIFVDGGYQII